MMYTNGERFPLKFETCCDLHLTKIIYIYINHCEASVCYKDFVAKYTSYKQFIIVNVKY